MVCDGARARQNMRDDRRVGTRSERSVWTTDAKRASILAPAAPPFLTQLRALLTSTGSADLLPLHHVSEQMPPMLAVDKLSIWWS
eukprot:2530500-Pleurochrysis_carterae.AAC.1